MTITDYSLQTESQKVLQTGRRISKCCVEWILINEKKSVYGNYKALVSAITLSKCLEASLWENSKYVTKQIEKIGITYSSLLANAGLVSWEKILTADPREIERVSTQNRKLESDNIKLLSSYQITGKCPPFGNDVISFAEQLPKYDIQLLKSQEEPNVIQVSVVQLNPDWHFEESKDEMYLIVGDTNNHILLFCEDL